MASLWRSWPVRELQELLERLCVGLLDDLAELLPALAGPGFNSMSLYTRESLALVAESFLPTDVFASKPFRKRCLDGLPPDELGALAKLLGTDQPGAEFVQVRDDILRRQWSPLFAAQWIAFFQLPPHFMPSQVSPVESSVSFLPPRRGSPCFVDAPFKQLKDYQFQIYFRALSQLTIPRARFVIQMPTGSGKTRTAMELLISTINSETAAAPVVLWLAHSSELCDQAFECFVEVWRHLGCRPLTAVRFWGNHPLPHMAEEAMFVVAGFQKLHQCDIETLAALRDRCTLVVVDEAHMTIAPTYRTAVQSLIGELTRVVGLTATPGRSTVAQTQNLAEFYFGEKLGLTAADGKSVIQSLRDRGVLSHAVHVPIVTRLNVSLDAGARNYLASNFDLPPNLLKRLGQKTVRNIEIVKRLVEEVAAGRQILFFGCSVAHSKFIASVLLYLRVEAAHIDGDTGVERRREVIEKFKTARVRVLCNYGVLATGFDAPKTDVVFISRPTMSPVLYSQMIGRGLRGPAIGGTPACRIIDVIDNIEGYGDHDRMYNLFEEMWL